MFPLPLKLTQFKKRASNNLNTHIKIWNLTEYEKNKNMLIYLLNVSDSKYSNGKLKTYHPIIFLEYLYILQYFKAPDHIDTALVFMYKLGMFNVKFFPNNCIS